MVDLIACLDVNVCRCELRVTIESFKLLSCRCGKPAIVRLQDVHKDLLCIIITLKCLFVYLFIYLLFYLFYSIDLLVD